MHLQTLKREVKMLCYRDMTFCPYYKGCKDGKSCPRSLTPEVVKKAEKWWKSKHPPISMFGEIPKCFK